MVLFFRFFVVIPFVLLSCFLFLLQTLSHNDGRFDYLNEEPLTSIISPFLLSHLCLSFLVIFTWTFSFYFCFLFCTKRISFFNAFPNLLVVCKNYLSVRCDLLYELVKKKNNIKPKRLTMKWCFKVENYPLFSFRLGMMASFTGKAPLHSNGLLNVIEDYKPSLKKPPQRCTAIVLVAVNFRHYLVANNVHHKLTMDWI